MKSFVFFLGIFLVILAGGILLGGLLVLLAYGHGWLLRRVLPLSPFEATLLSLIALICYGLLVYAFIRAPFSVPVVVDEDEEFDEESEDEPFSTKFDESVRKPVVVYLERGGREKNLSDEDIPVVAPDTRCPCGSGRKYKNCHGRIRARSKSI